MSRIRDKATRPEKIAERLLRKLGVPYKRNFSLLPGKPDFYLHKHKTAIFVHGCFWHSHGSCRDGRVPKSRVNYWRPKLQRTITRDQSNKRALNRKGLHVLTLWECKLERRESSTEERIRRALKRLISRN